MKQSSSNTRWQECKKTHRKYLTWARRTRPSESHNRGKLHTPNNRQFLSIPLPAGAVAERQMPRGVGKETPWQQWRRR